MWLIFFVPVEAIRALSTTGHKESGLERYGCSWGSRTRESAEKARAAGLGVVQSKCIKIEHSRIHGKHEFTITG
jgi:predicted CoA-binding protein